jgi:hypothetical protein
MTTTSDEIVFRSFRPGDAEALLRWASSPDELLQWTGLCFSFPLDERQLAEYADTSGNHRHLISAVTSTTETVVAHAELTVLPQHELGQAGRVAAVLAREVPAGLIDLDSPGSQHLALQRLVRA